MRDPLRVPIHSPFGRRLMQGGLLLCVSLLLSPIVLILLAIFGERPLDIASLIVEPALGLLLLPFFRRSSQSIHLLSSGLEIGPRVVPWSKVASWENLGWKGGLLMPLYRLSFTDRAPSIVFYGRAGADSLLSEQMNKHSEISLKVSTLRQADRVRDRR